MNSSAKGSTEAPTPTQALVPREPTEEMHKALLADQGFPLIQWGNALHASPHAGQVSREQLEQAAFAVGYTRWQLSDDYDDVQTEIALAVIKALGLSVGEE